jgi:hypothetical protein
MDLQTMFTETVEMHVLVLLVVTLLSLVSVYFAYTYYTRYTNSYKDWQNQIAEANVLRKKLTESRTSATNNEQKSLKLIDVAESQIEILIRLCIGVLKTYNYYMESTGRQHNMVSGLPIAITGLSRLEIIQRLDNARSSMSNKIEGAISLYGKANLVPIEQAMIVEAFKKANELTEWSVTRIGNTVDPLIPTPTEIMNITLEEFNAVRSHSFPNYIIPQDLLLKTLQVIDYLTKCNSNMLYEYRALEKKMVELQPVTKPVVKKPSTPRKPRAKK